MTARTDDLQRWLALEHEAVWWYGMIGARVSGLADAARTSYDAHRAARDRLMARVHDAGVEPVGPALTYGDGRVDTAKQARAAARGVEQRIAAASLILFGHSEPDDRPLAMRGLHRAALAGLDWGAEPSAFPGLA